MRIYIETLGCALNQADTNIMRQVLLANGHVLTENPETADALIVNTCTVRTDSEEKSVKTISKLIRANPKAKVIVAGCMASAQPYKIHRLFPKSILLAPENAHRVNEALASNPGEAFLEPSDEKREYMPLIKRGAIAVLPLNDGCLGNCSYCITVRARRRLLSRPPRRIVEAVQKLVDKGAYEIQLSSQDAGAYGIDLTGRQMLPDLIQTINDRVKGDYMLRVGMMNPNWVQPIIDELIEAYRLEHTFKFLHIPLQSGDNMVLKIMNREYRVEDFTMIVKEFKKKIPGITVATDIIVGHPGEDDEAFENTVQVLIETDIDRIHIARYSPRPHTFSARLPQVPDKTKKERSRILTELYEKLGYRKLSRHVGKVLEGVVVEDWGFGGKRSFTARTSNYMSIVLPWSRSLRLKDRVKALIASATYFDLRGEPVEIVG